MAPAQLRRFENELSTLPGILAGSEDIVLVNQIPPNQFTDRLGNAGFHLPTFRMPASSLTDPDFLSCEKGFLIPWGWSPAVHKLLAPLKSGCCPEFLNSSVADWREMHRELYSRKSSLEVLRSIVQNQNSENILSFNDLPEICTTHDQIVALQQKWEKVVVKASWSSSGRGLQILRQNEYNQTNRQVISGYLNQQGYVVAGPWHNKVLDFSLQFFSFGNGEIEFRGLTSFSTDLSGHYTGNYIQELPPNLAPELKEFLEQNLNDVKVSLMQSLLASNYSTDYYGWLGVDALIFKSGDESYKIHPCLEINCRLTMSAIALNLRTRLAESSTGEFRIMNGKEGTFSKFCDEMTAKEPLIMENGKIVRGFLPITPALPTSLFGAWISIQN